MIGVIADHYAAAAAANHFAEVMADSPLAYWRLGEDPTGLPSNSGSTTTSWAWNPGVTAGKAPLLADGGYAVAGSGTAPVLTSSAMPTGLAGSAVTAEAWVKLPNVNVAGAIVKIGNGSNGWGFGIGGTTWDNTGKQLIVLVEGLVWKPTGYNFAAGGGTYHVAVVRSGTSFTCYVNGTSVATVSHTSVNTPTEVATIGGSGANRNLPSTVDLDNAAIFTVSLSAARITAHHNGGAGSNTAIAADSPAVWFKLDETVTSYLTDASGNARHGTYVVPPALGAAGLVTGDTDPAANFDGTDDRATVSYGSWMTTNTFTVEAIIKPDALPAAGAFFLARHDSVWCNWDLLLTDDGRVRFRTMPTTGNFTHVQTAAGAVATGVKRHVAVTFNAGAVTIYVDGASAASGTLTKSEANNRPLYIGALGHPQAFYDGILDEVALFGTALSATRVAAHAA